MKIQLKPPIPREDFFLKLQDFVAVDKSFAAHPHNIKKPFFGTCNADSFKIKNTPSIWYRDSTILISGKFKNDGLEVLFRPNNLILIVFLVLALCGLAIILFSTGQENLGIITIVFIPVLIFYLLVPYFKNRDKFLGILKKITTDRI